MNIQHQPTGFANFLIVFLYLSYLFSINILIENVLNFFLFLNFIFAGENPSDAASQWNVRSGHPLGRRLGASPAHDNVATAPASANATTTTAAATHFEPTTTATSSHATSAANASTISDSSTSTAAATTTTTAAALEPTTEAATTASNWGIFEFFIEPTD